jgi:nucleoside-diphosphate-sugar epimerase
MLMKVLILGCGYTGGRLARWLTAQNVAVNITTRQGLSIAGINAPSFAFSCETTAEPVPLSPAAWEGVTHALSTIPPDNQGIDPIVASLIHELEASELQWFGYLSTTGVYGDTQGAWVDENTAVNPQTRRSQYRVTAESSFLNSKLPSHIFRLPGIYGPNRSILDRLRAGKVQRINKPGHVFSRVHVDDIVQALWISMQNPQANAIYNVSDDEPAEPSALVVEAANLLGMAPPELITFDPEKMSPMAASFWSECRRVSNQKLKKELGVQLLYPTYRQGLRAILQEEQVN